MSDTILFLANNISVRPWRIGDEGQLAYHGNNRKIWLNMTDRFPYPYKVSDAEFWINHCSDKANWIHTISHYDKPEDESDESFKARQSASLVPTDYAICHNDQPIGSCGYQFHPPAPRAIILGYWLGENYWRRGVATQVAKAFVDYTFRTFPWCVRIEGDTYSWNQGSQIVLKKAGFQFEGVQKMKAYKDGKYGDIVNFGVTRPGFVPVLMDTGSQP